MAKLSQSPGDYLKKSREAQDLSQLEVSKKLGYNTAQFISNWERDRSLPPINVLKKIARLYKVDPQDLFQIFMDQKVKIYKAELQRLFKRA